MTDLIERSTSAEDAPVAAVEPEELGIQPLRLLGLVGFLGFLFFIGGWQLLLIVGAFVVFIMIHELGHYAFAKWSGMKVTEYFIGFGPRVFAFKRGEVTYGLKAIPAGAYVRIIGMNNLEDVDPIDEPRTYRQAAWHKRMLTIAAGPLSHFVIAIALAFFVILQAGQPVEGEWQVAQTIPFGAAESAGILEGDRILSIGDDVTSDFDLLAEVVRSNRGQEVDIAVARPTDDGNGDSLLGSGFNDIVLTTTIGEVLTDEGAGFALIDGQSVDRISGLFPGDMVTAVNGEPVANYNEFLAAAQPFEGGQVEVDVVYNRSLHTETVTINALETDASIAARGFLGVGQGEVRESQTLSGAVTGSIEIVGDTTKLLLVEMPKRLATRAGVLGLFGLSSESEIVPEQSVGAPAVSEIRPIVADENRVVSIIGAIQIARELADSSWLDVVGFLILINISFGILNALPMLPLDGGHMVIATYERLRSFGGRVYHADAEKLLPVTYFVVGVLMLIGGIAMVRDVIDPIQIPG